MEECLRWFGGPRPDVAAEAPDDDRKKDEPDEPDEAPETPPDEPPPAPVKDPPPDSGPRTPYVV